MWADSRHYARVDGQRPTEAAVESGLEAREGSHLAGPVRQPWILGVTPEGIFSRGIG